MNRCEYVSRSASRTIGLTRTSSSARRPIIGKDRNDFAPSCSEDCQNRSAAHCAGVGEAQPSIGSGEPRRWTRSNAFTVSASMSARLPIVRRRRADLLLQEAAIEHIARLKDLVVGPWSPALRQGLSEPVDKTLCESVEGQRVQSAGMAAMATLADARRQIARRVALEAYGENAPRRGRDAGLEQIGGALGQELRLAGAGTRNDRSIVGRANYLERIGFELVDADGAPIVRPNAAGEDSHGQSRRTLASTCFSTAASTSGMPSRSSFGFRCVRAARCVAGLLFVRKW